MTDKKHHIYEVVIRRTYIDTSKKTRGYSHYVVESKRFHYTLPIAYLGLPRFRYTGRGAEVEALSLRQ